MLKYIFAFILSIHGLIHLMGFAKAFGLGQMAQLSKEISKPVGVIWFTTAILFVITLVLFLMEKESWSVLALIAVVVSQVLVIATWQDAKFGTIANVVVLIVATFSLTSQRFEAQFCKDVNAHLKKSDTMAADLLTEADLQPLPLPVQKYLRYANVLGKPKVKNVCITFDGEMRSRGKDWFKFTTEQYNFFDEPSRLFFMKAQMFGITLPGYHKYENKTATMDIRLFGLFPVAQASGPEMNRAETVTLLNDLCLFVPAALIDKRIEWEAIDSVSVGATFTNGSNVISATLYFNEVGQLINFVSDDRFDISEMKQYPFSTPMKGYNLFDGIRAQEYGEAIWHYPEGAFVYGKFNVKSIKYNVVDLE